MKLLPIVEIEGQPGVYRLAHDYEGDAFEIPKDLQSQVKMKKAKLEYYSNLLGTTTKTIWLCHCEKHLIGSFVQTTEIPYYHPWN